MSQIKDLEIIQDQYSKQFETQQQTLNGSQPDFLAKIRKEAFANFQNLGFPSIKHEEWKYTNVKKIFSESYVFGEGTSLDFATIEPFLVPDLEANRLVFVNGFYQETLSQVTDSQIIIQNLKEAAKAKNEVLEKYLGQNLASQTEAFIALNLALAQDGVFIHIPKSTTIEKPIVLYFFSDAQNKAVQSQVHNFILVEENAEVSFIEKHNKIGGYASFTNAITAFVVEKEARTKHFKIQNDAENAHFIGTTLAHQSENSVFSNYTLSLSGGMVRNNLNLLLDGEHCEGNMFGLYMLQNNTHVDNHTVVDHLKPNSLSNELYKGILDGKSTGVFNGKIFVRQDAQKTNAYQQNRNVLLSQGASINTKPQLEIWADDVKCSHGATTGSLDEAALFYLRARGIQEQDARALLIQAFANDIIEKVEIESLKSYLQNLVAERLEVEVL